jgi:hypothetical protein
MATAIFVQVLAMLRRLQISAYLAMYHENWRILNTTINSKKVGFNSGHRIKTHAI